MSRIRRRPRPGRRGRRPGWEAHGTQVARGLVIGETVGAARQRLRPAMSTPGQTCGAHSDQPLSPATVMRMTQAGILIVRTTRRSPQPGARVTARATRWRVPRRRTLGAIRATSASCFLTWGCPTSTASTCAGLRSGRGSGDPHLTARSGPRRGRGSRCRCRRLSREAFKLSGCWPIRAAAAGATACRATGADRRRAEHRPYCAA